MIMERPTGNLGSIYFKGTYIQVITWSHAGSEDEVKLKDSRCLVTGFLNFKYIVSIRAGI